MLRAVVGACATAPSSGSGLVCGCAGSTPSIPACTSLMQPSMRSKAAFSIISTTTCSIGGAGGGIDCPAAVSQRWQQVDAALGLANAPFAYRVPEFARRLLAPAQQEVAGAVDLGR